MVDLEKHQVIDLLPDRETQTLNNSLDQHPGVEIVSRDRASTYALAATQAAPDVLQVADRWHLLKNLGDAIQRVLETNRPAMKLASEEIVQSFTHQPVLHKDLIPVATASKPVSNRQRIYQLVKEYQTAGQSIRWVASQLGMSRNTVRKYWRWTTYQPKTIRRWSPLLRHEEYLRRRWN